MQRVIADLQNHCDYYSHLAIRCVVALST
jgi:hypothetical protein